MNQFNTTYRVQFNENFKFSDLRNILPYLKELGITTIYASPIFEAVPGSIHGYDIVHPNRINPEIGTEAELREISRELKENGMTWLQDIVPNHMAYHHQNEWLFDVLEKGPQSRYKSFFDTVFSSAYFEGRMMAPFLGKSFDEVINAGELKLDFVNGRCVLNYYGSYFPLHPSSYPEILGRSYKPRQSILLVKQQMEEMEFFEDPVTYSEKWHELLLQLTSLMRNKGIDSRIRYALDEISEDKTALKQLASKQHYRLCHWRETEEQINYRRFFTINSLICLNIDDEKVFAEHHALVIKLVNEGIFDGLRIDHIDGLYNPTAYLERLRAAVGDQVYITVEKILGADEGLPQEWPVQGTTGYDFLAVANNLLTNKKAEKNFTRFYREISQQRQPVEKQVLVKKRMILERYMQGELQNLTRFFLQSVLTDERSLKKIAADDIRSAIGEFLVHLPVYRYYGKSLPLDSGERKELAELFNKMEADQPRLKAAIGLLRKILVDAKTQNIEAAEEFYRRCMQLSGPLMAKGVEDSLMYSYNSFMAHNEVGDHPGAFGISVDDFHQWMQRRQLSHGLSMNATATHDTKRGEDARARLNVLTDVDQEWRSHVEKWRGINKDWRLKQGIDANDEYLLYQALVAHTPMTGENKNDFAGRLQRYLEKAVREAKVKSNWSEPNIAYESTLKKFSAALLQTGSFQKSFQNLFEIIPDHGIINSLTQTILKFTCPGVADIYQGTELWDLSFVDPDNRRPVDYGKRQALLDSFTKSSPEMIRKRLWPNRLNGAIKLYLVQQLARMRRNDPQFWNSAAYLPLNTTGTYKENILSFARISEKAACIIVVPLHTAGICAAQNLSVENIDWKDTAVILPEEVKNDLRDVWGKKINRESKIPVTKLFNQLPFAILQTISATPGRSAGVLLSVTSLPSAYGIGDVGPAAKNFVNFLAGAGQKYWQILPLNPVESGQGYSPYSSTSGKAGNPLLISPEWLCRDGLLTKEDISNELPVQPQVMYSNAEKLKYPLLQKAFRNFKKSPQYLQEEFTAFCAEENEWLDDYAAYTVIKSIHKKPWYRWPDTLKFRKKGYRSFLKDHAAPVEEVKWQQFMFFRQWHELKSYCRSKKIRIIGDLPFYVSYDSADVWANQQIFALDKKGAPTGVAGVPPDAFSEDGQLWGMPVYNWRALKEQDYKWWLDRIKVNLELFDLVRIDHFRAMESYWEVPPAEKTAKNGAWKKTPGEDFLSAIQKHFGELPFIAEDLGDVNENVFRLRDQFQLPGMKVLQFAFGEDLPASPHIPHNYVENCFVYTGTHDNNTTRGWFENELSDQGKQQLSFYTGKETKESDAAATLIRMAYGSVARVAIVPLQDVLNQGSNARMNTPSSTEGNWSWRALPEEFTDAVAEKLNLLVKFYNR